MKRMRRSMNHALRWHGKATYKTLRNPSQPYVEKILHLPGLGNLRPRAPKFQGLRVQGSGVWGFGFGAYGLGV